MNLQFELHHETLGTRLVEPPADWPQVGLELRRNPQQQLSAHGVVQERLVVQQWGLRARSFLAQVLGSYGVDAIVHLRVLRSGAAGTEVLTHLEMDLHTLRLHDGITAACHAVTGGVQRTLMARYATPVDVARTAMLAGTPLQHAAANAAQQLVLNPVLPSANMQPLQTQGYYLHDALNRAALLLTDNTVALHSRYLGRASAAPHATDGGPAADAMLLCGLQARGWAQAPVYVSLQQVLHDAGCVFGLGYGVEQTGGTLALRVEPIRYFYDEATEAAAFFAADAVAAQLQLAPNPDLQFNQLVAGYEPVAVANGQDEFNTGRTYRLAGASGIGAQAAGALNIRSVLVAAGRVLDAMRVLGTTADSSVHDDALFLVRTVAGAGGIRQLAQGVQNAGGLQDAATATGWSLSPWASAVRWWQWWGSAFADGGIATVASASGNSAASGGLPHVSAELRPGLHYAEPTALHTEQDALQNLGAYRNENGHGYLQPFLQPTVLRGQSPCTWQQYQALRANPYGVVRVQVGSGIDNAVQTYRGFVRSLRFMPVAGLAQWELALARS
jgi:hypothetical protein